MHERRPPRVTPLAIVIGFAGALALAACGDARPASSTGLPVAGSRAPASRTLEPVTPVPSEAPITFEPDPTDMDTGSPGTPPCAIEDLKASRGITEADADDRTTEVVLVAASTCSVDAFPTLLLEDADEHILVAASAGGPGGIDLVPGVAYTSEVRLSNWCLSEPSFPVTIGIVHGIQTLLVTGDSFPDEGDLPPCVHEDADPVLSGTAWAPPP